MYQSEFEIIRRYFVDSGLYFTAPGIELGIGDDAALLHIPQGKLLAISMDVLVEAVHFPVAADAGLLANRALAVNLSDLAAMAAEPFCFTLGLVLPSNNEQWLEGFSQGLLPLAKKYNCPLVGGDISRGPLSICIQVQGLCDKDKAVKRSGAVVGDKIYVSGTLGDGAIALASLGLKSHLGVSFAMEDESQSSSFHQYFKNAYYKPEPRIELATECATLLTSNIDISDGLLGDLAHIIDASDVGAQLLVHRIPYSEAALCCMSAENRLMAALHGGDDYELCCTVAPQNCEKFEKKATQLGARVTCIGEIVAGSGIRCLDESGTLVNTEAGSYLHF
ncbi:MAG: thiamine-phosphate kinase [SAR86 cluster bacterium]|uniref:Thiamine-monophosphate kinase n=1 Tax=SAR86 cluster bacterium TaxID=2030880 RepID=A0A2A5B5S3_9GAMM|nr:MAG: thiamine-phosphate kinase [SAR86 cluster bacterium]